MSDEELRGFAVVLDQENPDLFKWLTGQLQPPPEMVGERSPARPVRRVRARFSLVASR